MGSVFVDKDRKVIPRWRNSRVTAVTGELDTSTSKCQPHVLPQTSFVKKLRDWESKPSVGLAGEVVSAALVLRKEQDARGAAEFLIQEGSRATATLKRLAQRVLGPDYQSPQAPRPSSGHSDRDWEEQEVRQHVHNLKTELQESPRNSLRWVDLSRLYAMLGQPHQAKRAMEIALKLSPENRFVLRSATRLFVHLHEPDRGHDILRSNARTRVDPWLLSAELSAASIAGRVSRHTRSAWRLIEFAGLPPLQITELASALATLHLEGGDTKAARKLFRQSLDDPTENSVAQADWAARRIGGVEVDPQLVRSRRSYEAQAWKSYQAAHWKEAVRSCELWLGDEPFSSRPAQMGSYLAAVALEDFERAEQLAALGLLANPEDEMLLNNLAVFLANRGFVGKGWEAFRKINRPHVDVHMRTTLLATEGLLTFRSGDVEKGRAFYLEAISTAEPKSRLRALAALHLAREEVNAGTTRVSEAVDFAMQEASAIGGPDIVVMKERLERRSPK